MDRISADTKAALLLFDCFGQWLAASRVALRSISSWLQRVISMLSIAVRLEENMECCHCFQPENSAATVFCLSRNRVVFPTVTRVGLEGFSRFHVHCITLILNPCERSSVTG